MNFSEYKEFICGKKVAVVGLGRSNMPLIELLASCGAEIIACDKAADIGEKKEKLEKLGVALSLGENYLNLPAVDFLFRTPGVRPDIEPFEKLKKQGTVITSEMELFFELCPCEIFGITGSDGKTTTTTLICKMLERAGYTCHLGGNIGRPLIGDIEKIKPEDKVVVELSSFQLFGMKKSPHVSVITNLSPNHLDWHRDYNEYIEAKTHIMQNQTEKDFFVVNADDNNTLQIGKTAKGKTVSFSYEKKTDVYCDGKSIFYGNEKILDIEKIRIVGRHNVYNYMTAICATLGYVSFEDVRAVAESFGGVEHRIEFVRRLDGVDYYNSSIDSSPNRTKNTISVFDKNVVLIAGGKDKGIPYDEIGKPILDSVKVLILIGMTSDVIEAAVRKASTGYLPEIIRANTYPEAVQTAREKAVKGDVVLLSPASTSFDIFNNFEERGNLFKRLVGELK